jgi:hypothetical protein
MKGANTAVEVSAPELAKLAIEAHGGLERWKRFTTLSVHGINGGVLWGAKGKAGVLDYVTITVDLRDEKVSRWPFGSADRRSRFEPQRVVLEKTSGKAAHYVSDLKEFSGVVFPAKRRIFPRQPDGHSAPEPLVVSIDLDQFVLS